MRWQAGVVGAIQVALVATAIGRSVAGRGTAGPRAGPERPGEGREREGPPNHLVFFDGQGYDAHPSRRMLGEQLAREQ